MSIFSYLFDNDWKQRRDIDDLREMQHTQALAPSGGASEKWVEEIAHEVKELAATVTVLMRTLADANLLDVKQLQAQVAEELQPKKRSPLAKPVRPPKPEGPITDEVCSTCGTKETSDQMVRVGQAWFCRPCARNP